MKNNKKVTGDSYFLVMRQFLKRITTRRLQSTASVSHSVGNSGMSLDLDFVLGLLDSSKSSENNGVSPTWTRMKFREIEKTAEESTKGGM